MWRETFGTGSATHDHRGSQPQEEPLNDNTEDDIQASSFADLAGELPADVLEVIEFIKNPERFARVGAAMPKGILLYGPPGTGKTSIARAIAGEAEAAFFNASGTQFIEMYVGVGPKRVRELFEKARTAVKSGKYKRAIIFIDEIDAIGSSRTGENNSEYRSTLNELLNQLDGFGKETSVFVIAATNTPEILDKALLRPGRFDRLVHIALPDKKSREQILQLYAHGKKCKFKEIILQDIAEKTDGFSGAQLKELMNYAATLAARDSASAISETHMAQALKNALQQHRYR